jgi:hypothetical protein
MVSPCGLLIPIPYSPSGVPQNPAVKKNPALPNFHHGCRENSDEPFGNTPSKKKTYKTYNQILMSLCSVPIGSKPRNASPKLRLGSHYPLFFFLVLMVFLERLGAESLSTSTRLVFNGIYTYLGLGPV